jgi:hypothetical protein
MRGAGMAAALAASDAELFGSPAWMTEAPAAFRAMFAQGLEGYADDRLADGAGWITFDVAPSGARSPSCTAEATGWWTSSTPSVMLSIDVTPKPAFIPARCDWSAGSHRRSLAEVLAGTAPGCDSAAPGQHEARRASGPDSPHLRSGISAQARPRRSLGQRDPPRSTAPDDHAGRAPRPEPARASSTSPEMMSHRPRRDLVRWLVEPGVPVVLVAACPAPQRHMAHAPALSLGLACWFADAWKPRDFLRHAVSRRMPVRAALGLVGKEWCRHPMIMP